MFHRLRRKFYFRKTIFIYVTRVHKRWENVFENILIVSISVYDTVFKFILVCKGLKMARKNFLVPRKVELLHPELGIHTRSRPFVQRSV